MQVQEVYGYAIFSEDNKCMLFNSLIAEDVQ